LQGRRFGKLTVIEFDHSNKNGAYWKCQCDCGNQHVASAHGLKTGHISSCGCLAYTSFGYSHERLYKIWKDMKYRCYSRTCKSFPNYGGRGIAVCSEWKSDYSNFRRWALSNGYERNLTIDRINANGNYEPGNCRWATYKEQENNTRKNRFIAYNGVTHTVAEWADILGLSYAAVRSRANHGWAMERIVNTPCQKRIMRTSA